MAISKLTVIQPLVSFCRGKIFDHNLFFCGIVLDPDMLESQSRALKTRMDNSLV